MRVLLVNPPIFLSEEERGAVERLHNSSWPIGLAYLASMVRDLDMDVKVLDAHLYNLSKIKIEEEIRRYRPDVVGVTSTTASIQAASTIIRSAKEQCKGVTTILGGAHMTAAPQKTMEVFPQIDIGVVGDGEEIFRRTMEALISGGNLAGVNGILYRNGEGIVQNPPMVLGSLDDIPFPAWDLLPPLREYRFQPATYLRHPHAFVTASRGCPYQCIFCHVSKFRPRIRYRSPANVIDEIELLIEKYGVKEIRFADELFTSNKKWVDEVCSLIREKGFEIPWTCDARANLLTPEIAETLRKAGCWQVSMGVESGSPRILERIKKGITREQVMDAVAHAHAAHLSVRAYFMLGFPFETRKDIEETIQFAKSSGVDFAQFSYATPFPGTELYGLCLARGDFKDPGWLEYKASTYQEPAIVPDGMTREDLKGYFRRGYREFYLRPSLWYRLLKSIRSLEDVKRYLHGVSALAKI